MNVELDYNEKTNQCRIILDNQEIKDRLYHAFSTPNEAKKFVKGPSKRWISDRIYFITPSGNFNFGLTETILKWFKKYVNEITIQYKFSQSFKNRFKLTKDSDIIYINNLNLTLRDYQKHSVYLAQKYGYGTFVLGTGAGKTLTIASIIDNLFAANKVKRVMILVPDTGLVTQFNQELSEVYGVKQKISLFYDKFNKIDPDSQIIIANRQLFLSRFTQNEKFFRNDIDCLIVDEAHSIKKSNKVSKCIAKMNCFYKFGFTGTLAPEIEDKMSNLGLLGPVRTEVTSKELRDLGYLSNVTINAIGIIYPNTIERMSYRDEVEFLEKSDFRNNKIRDLVYKLENNTLIMVNHLEHGFNLERILKEYNSNGKDIYFIRGEVDVEERDKIKALMEEKDNIIVIAITKIFSTGINIKNLHNIILASGGKSAITVVQSIGRGLRLHPSKKELNIYDISDRGCKYSMGHYDKRLKIYEKEKIKVKRIFDDEL